MTTRVKSSALAALLVLATLVLLQLAAGVVVPFVLAVLMAFALNPIVRAVERVIRSRAIAAGLTVLALLAAVLGSVYALSDDAALAAEHLPEATARLRDRLRDLHQGSAAPLGALGRAADNLEAAASEAAGAKSAPRTSAWDGLGLRDWLVVGSMSIVGFSGQFLLLVFLVYFLLASGDLFKRKIVRLAGPELSARRTTVETLDDIRRTLERFTLVVIATNAIVGVASYFAFRAIGFANAGLWAVVGGLLNTVPYVGSAVTTAVIFLVGLLQYDRLDMAVLAAGLFLVITTVEGMLLTPWWMGRMGRLNNPAVFTGLLFWGWLWGAWGMLLAYPILMVIKTIADHVDRFNAVGELLGE